MVERYNLGPEALAAPGKGGTVLGRRLAEALGVMVGDDLRVVAPPPDAASADPGKNSAVSVVCVLGRWWILVYIWQTPAGLYCRLSKPRKFCRCTKLATALNCSSLTRKPLSG